MASSSRFLSSSSSSSSDEEEFIAARLHRENMQMLSYVLPSLVGAALSVPPRRRYIHRDRERGHQQLWRDYFAENCTYPPEHFRQRFRMRRELFLRILRDIEAYDQYFVQKKDATGRLGCSSIQKMTAAVRILAYGMSAEHRGEYKKIGESTAIESLKHFCNAIIALYEAQYFRPPNHQDVARLLREAEERGLPGMLGSLDCMHWQWKNCPTAWHDTRRTQRQKPTLILEAVASKDLWLWHAFFGMVGAHDITVLDHSPLFDALIHGRMPPVNYVVKGRTHNLGYYLADDIYPQCATLLHTISHPVINEERLFAQKQDALRKDVEQAIGVLHIKWGITQGPERFWSKDDLSNIMRTCIILHNMTIEDERGCGLEEWTPPLDEAIPPPEYTRSPELMATRMLARIEGIDNQGSNAQLRADLIDHFWNHFGD